VAALRRATTGDCPYQCAITRDHTSLYQCHVDRFSLTPFTVSLPLQWPLRDDRCSRAHASSVYVIRVTVLTAELYQTLIEGLFKRCQASPLRSIGPYMLEIQQVFFTDNSHPLVAVSTYEALYTVSSEPTVTMHFLTPTSFRTGSGLCALGKNKQAPKERSIDSCIVTHRLWYPTQVGSESGPSMLLHT